MIAIAVDDERPMLQALAEAVSASPDIHRVHTFATCTSALEWLAGNTVDVAFLDIHMRGMGGLALAEEISRLHPQCRIVFCTGYEQYALDAIRLRCSGYLLKPITPEAVQKELDHIKKQSVGDRKLTVKCFGSFEVLYNGQALTFKRTKAKELLAVLVDRNGAGLTGKQICAILWPEDSDDTKNMDYFRHLVQDLRNTLNAVGAENVLCHEQYQYRIDPAQINCDYHNYLQYGKPDFLGEYMTQYSWAEGTCGFLQK